MKPTYFTPIPVPSFVAPVAAAKWPENLRSALVAKEVPVSVEPISGTSTPDLGCWRTLEPATVGTLTLLVQLNPFEAYPFNALRDIVMDALPQPTMGLERSHITTAT